ncbi:type II secretion system protein GspD, partial [Candidatus Poribacteria bacterium]|nr:type II secretion system protein GspD [Candidatus Poribacteria bacterium]
RGVTAQQRGIIRGITLEVREGPPPLCTVHIHLARRLPYEVKDNIGNELRFTFENPLLEQTVTIKSGQSGNEELRKLLFTLFQLYGANFIADKEVNLDEPVTFNLEGVPLRVALDQILNSRGYGYKEIEDGILRIMPLDKLEQAVQPTEASKGLPKVLSVKTFRLEHAPVATVRAALETFKSPDGKIVEDERTQTILFMDTEEQLAHVGALLEEMVQTLDQVVPTVAPKPEPVTIPPAQPIRRVILLNYANPEQIKEMLAPYLTSKGEIQAFAASAGPGGAGGAGATGGGGAEGGAAGGVTLGQPVGRGGYLVVIDLPESIADIERAVVELDVPTPQVEIQVHVIEANLEKGLDAGVDWTGVDKERKAMFSVSNTGGTLKIGTLTSEQFTAVLNALATQSNTRLLSNPHITVVENKLAQFHSGEEVPFRKIVIQQGIEEIEVFFKSVGIVLTVMAQVKSDHRVSLLVNAEVSSIGERPPGGEPSILTRNASTQMLVPDGDTVAIGGLTSDRTIETITKVPILGHIPLIGALFSSRQYTKTRNEITIYLTPHIVNE